MEKTLSICIPTFNRVNKLEKILNFFDREKVFENNRIEFIVSNNGSDDNTSIFLKKFSENKKSLIVLESIKNVGLVNNFRKCVDNATNDYVWIVGDDDVLYQGIIGRIFDILDNYPDLNHIFLNYTTLYYNKRYKKEYVERYDYSNNNGYMNGLKLFSNVTEKSEIGMLMFITANIYKRKLLLEVNEIIDYNNESHNLALPLGYSLYCSKGNSYLENDRYVQNVIGEPSWSYSQKKVFCRDIIAICDIVSLAIDKQDEISKVLINNLPYRMPELEFIFYKHRFKVDNYAFKWMMRDHKGRLIKDFIVYPFSIFKRIIIRLIIFCRHY